MAKSFVLRADARKPADPVRRAVLVTGASGNIGSYFAEHCHQRYDLRLMIRPGDNAEGLRRFGQTVEAELSNLDRLKELTQGIDTVVHLAASASPDTVWQDLLDNNITGTYNVFVAAKASGCRRVIFASSIHAISGHPVSRQVHADDPVNPGDLYGVSKCFGEALARYMAEQQGLSAMVIRIGAFQPVEAAREPDSLRFMDAWISRRDMNQLLERCIDNEDVQFAILHGLSDNRFNRMDITSTMDLVGYRPQDDLTEVNPHVRHLDLDKLQTHDERGGGQQSGIREELAPAMKVGDGEAG